MQIMMRTAVIPIEAIQAAYNEAVMSGRDGIGTGDRTTLAQCSCRAKGPANSDRRQQMAVEKRKPSDLCTGDEPRVVNRPPA